MEFASFHKALAENSADGIAFVDAGRVIQFWNCALERVTGVEARAVVGQPWNPSFLDLRWPADESSFDADCPLRFVLQTGEQCFRRAEVRGRHGRPLPVDVHLIPAGSHDGTIHGIAVVVRDVSSELSLEARCQRLHELATRDPLTHVANRAELDRVHEALVAMHRERGLPYSLVMVDLDHFKSINDRFGHPAGDEVLRNAAGVLKSFCRLGDLVGRYGGEEFAILLADCSGTVATRRAEELRRALAETPQPALMGGAVTGSFGVTEMQPPETAASMLARADRALLCAKERNRNRVVYLGADGNDRESLSQVVSELRHALAITAGQTELHGGLVKS